MGGVVTGGQSKARDQGAEMAKYIHRDTERGKEPLAVGETRREALCKG